MPTEPPPVCPSDKGLTELWLSMVGAFGHKWASSHGELPVEKGEGGERTLTRTGAIWQRGLAGIDDAMVRRGFEECIHRADDWPPTLPAFRRMALGIPSLAQVKADLRGTEQPHQRAPFTRLLWSYLDHYLLARSDAATAERLFREAYELAVDYVLRGGPMPEASKPLAPPPPPPRTAPTPETETKAWAEIKRRVGDWEALAPESTHEEAATP